MRELKFRAWLPKEKKMAYSVPVGADGFYRHCISEGFALQYDPQYEKLPVMQFTGLRDSTGKEIYDGDIVKVKGFDPANYEVVFDRGGFCLKWGDDANYYPDIKYAEKSKVIGNKYENPKLYGKD